MTTLTFTKKPISIEAVQWNGQNIGEVAEFIGDDSDPNETNGYTYTSENSELLIHTLEGTQRASIGDWIIKGVQGEFYPCKPDIFRASYKPDAGDWCTACRKVVDLDEEVNAWIDEDEGGWLHQACGEIADDVEANR